MGGQAKKTPAGPARNEALEAVIDAAPDDPNGYLVYADWLQQQGDRRGELIVLQYRLSADPDNEAILDEERKFLRKHEKELLGPLASYAFVRRPTVSAQGLAWRLGFLRSARVRRTTKTPVPEVVARILAHPAGRFLARLVAGRMTVGADTDRSLEPLFEVLGAKAPATLETLVLGDETTEVEDISTLWSAVPTLRHLALFDLPSRYGAMRSDRLTSLTVHTRSIHDLAPFLDARFPALRRLSITIVADTSEAGGYDRVEGLSKFVTTFPGLDELHVRNLISSRPDRYLGEPIEFFPRDAAALAAVDAAAACKIPRVVLDTPLSAKGVAALVERAPCSQGPFSSCHRSRSARRPRSSARSSPKRSRSSSGRRSISTSKTVTFGATDVCTGVTVAHLCVAPPGAALIRLHGCAFRSLPHSSRSSPLDVPPARSSSRSDTPGRSIRSKTKRSPTKPKTSPGTLTTPTSK